MTMLGLAIAFALAPTLLNLLAVRWFGVEPVRGRHALDPDYWRASGIRLAIEVVASGFGGVGHAAATAVTASALGYRRSDGPLRTVLSLGPRAFAIEVLVLVISLIGILLVIVPGFIALTIFYVAIPVMALEGSGVFASLNQSRALTKGYRWSIFGIGALIIIVHLGIGFIQRALMHGDVHSYTSIVVRAAIAALIAGVGMNATPVVYFELCRLKRGLAPFHMEDVFG